MNEGSNTGKVEKQDGTILNWANILDNLKDDISNIVSLISFSIGKNGGSYINDTNQYVPDSDYKFFAIQTLEEIVIDTVVGNVDISGATIPANAIIYGEWTSITFTSGEAIAYQKES